MENLKQKFAEQEAKNRQLFENFVQKRQHSEFLTNMLILKMRFFHYKELLKLLVLNIRKPAFEATRNSVFMFLILPSVVALGFNIMSPFSLLRGVGVYGAFGASITCFVFSFADEMHQVAQNDQDLLGFQVRYRYSQLAAYDNLEHAYREEIS